MCSVFANVMINLIHHFLMKEKNQLSINWTARRLYRKKNPLILLSIQK